LLSLRGRAYLAYPTSSGLLRSSLVLQPLIQLLRIVMTPRRRLNVVVTQRTDANVHWGLLQANSGVFQYLGSLN
jgi:hypothetical protein